MHIRNAYIEMLCFIKKSPKDLEMKIMNVIALKSFGIIIIILLSNCTSKKSNQSIVIPTKIIDLGALITEDLPERVWGKASLTARKYTRPNSFDVIKWDRNGIFTGSNSYYTLFNHGGPHVDAPIHMGLKGGLDNYAIESFAGPLIVVDVSTFEKGFTVTRDIFEELNRRFIKLIS